MSSVQKIFLIAISSSGVESTQLLSIQNQTAQAARLDRRANRTATTRERERPPGETAQAARSWCRLAYEPTFEALHSLRTATAPGFILGTLRRNILKYDFLPLYSSRHYEPHYPFSISSLLPCKPGDLSIEATEVAHGLLLCVENANSVARFSAPTYYITRLGTPHHRRIPNPSIRFLRSCSSIVCDVGDSSKEFKIVRIYESMRSPKAKVRACACEIFDSTTDKWRRSKDLPYLELTDSVSVVIKQTI
ncbi:F-box protein [Platanthera zijinensis]|uniref:F-box protein n=1 Tax=Platanthera zijinensis TaxID=2320716 RepID=A0AAP0GEK0_9ASPA